MQCVSPLLIIQRGIVRIDEQGVGIGLRPKKEDCFKHARQYAVVIGTRESDLGACR